MNHNRSRAIWAVPFALTFVLAAQPASAATPFSADAKAPLSSSFPGPLWQVVAPKGGTASVSNAHLFLNVPGGSNHDAMLPSNQSPSNQAVRLVQPIGNVDFDVSIKIDSPLEAKDAGIHAGLMVLANDKNFLTFALGTDGTEVSLSAYMITGGVSATIFEAASFREYQTPMYLRLARSGSTYLAYYSVDGVVWTQAASFANPMVPTSIGPFASNYNPTPTKAVPVTMAINWFDIL
jgi:hypothetical protein